MKVYAKAIVAFFTGLSAWGFTALLDDAISKAEIFGLLGVAVTAAGVYLVPNETPAA